MGSPSSADLRKRLAEAGKRLGAREAEHGAALAEAWTCADALRQRVAEGIEAFHEAASAGGAPHLRVEISETRTDDKHLRSVEFELLRGRHRGVITVKSRGDVTLVGPFKAGKNEGPCRSFPMQEQDEIAAALGDFLERFLEDAAAP